MKKIKILPCSFLLKNKFNNYLNKIDLMIVICLLLYLSPAAHAQKSDLNFERLSLMEGRSQSTVYSIIQDSEGFMWFGTGNGLIRYDGYNFREYRHDPGDPKSLSENNIWSICEDRLGALWIGTYGGGINKYNRDNDNFISSNKKKENGFGKLKCKKIRIIYEDRSGTLWIGSKNRGLYKYDRENDKFIHFMNDPDDPNSLSDNDIRSIYEDRSGTLWIGTNNGGLDKLAAHPDSIDKGFDQKNIQFIHFKNNPADHNSLSSNEVRAIYEDRSGTLWIGTIGGLNKFDRKNNKFIHYKHNPDDSHSLSDNIIRAIYEDRSGALWIGTVRGLNKYNKIKNNFIRYQNDPDNTSSLSNNRVRVIYEDQSGSLWIGTKGGGINKCYQKKKEFVHYKNDPDDLNSLSHNEVHVIYEDHYGMFWIGTDRGGLDKFDRESNKFVSFKSDSDDPNSFINKKIRVLFEDSLNILWIGTKNEGLYAYDPENDKLIHYQNDPDDPYSLSCNKIRAILEDRSGTLWIGTYGGGLNKFDRKNRHFIHYKKDPEYPHSLSNNKVRTIYEDRSGILWIGTGNGLNKFDPKLNQGKNNQFSCYRNDGNSPDSRKMNSIYSIYEDISGALWIGTDGSGLIKFNREEESFTHYQEEYAISNDVIYGILEDSKGYLWLSTNRGLSKFNPSGKDGKQFKNYNVKDGLQSNSFNAGAYCKSKNGEMFFGGVNGFNSFFPDSINDNLHIPSIVITDLQIFNKSVLIGKGADERLILKKNITRTEEIKLSYKDYIFSFEFAALDFACPERNEYTYMMEGIDKHWNYVRNRRFVTYQHLPPGEYTFRVKGCNNDGIWNERGAAIRVVITPPFWQTWWFRILAALLIIILAYTIYKLRIRSITAHREMLRVQVNERTIELKKRNSELSEAKKETDNILQNVEEGFFLLNSAFEIGSQYSRSLIIILEDKDLAYKNFIKMLKQNIPAKTISTTEEYLELMFNDDIDEETLKELNPLAKIELNFKNIDGRWVASKHLSFKFKRITDYKSKTTGIIVTVTDITDKIHLAKQLKESEAHTKQQIEWMVNILHVEPELLREFMEGGRKELNYIEDLLKQDKTENDYITSLENIYRSMHLIKGNASLLDLKFFVKKTHDFEDEIAKIKEKTKIESSDFVPLVLQLNEMQKTLDELNDLIERISYIHTQFRPKRSYENKLFIQSIQNLIENLAKDLGKEIKFIHNKFDAGVVPHHYKLLTKEIIIQLARNSVFHGIESADERIKLNKEPYGAIEISSFIKNNKFGFTFLDDGRGLDIEKLRKKAKEFGKWDNAEIDRWDDKQTADIIFTQGISTSEKAELAAGRGVGMDIIKQKLEKNNGQIKMSFSKGKFCKFEISLPVKKKNTKDKTKKVRVSDM